MKIYGKLEPMDPKFYGYAMLNAGVAHLDNAILLNMITTYFSFEELKTLAFEMGYDHETINSPDKITFIREFILLIKRRKKEDYLYNCLKAKRPNILNGT